MFLFTLACVACCDDGSCKQQKLSADEFLSIVSNSRLPPFKLEHIINLRQETAPLTLEFSVERGNLVCFGDYCHYGLSRNATCYDWGEDANDMVVWLCYHDFVYNYVAVLNTLNGVISCPTKHAYVNGLKPSEAWDHCVLNYSPLYFFTSIQIWHVSMFLLFLAATASIALYGSSFKASIVCSAFALGANVLLGMYFRHSRQIHEATFQVPTESK
jgi:hypothetical protein